MTEYREQVDRINAEVSEQADLIAQIQAALDGKAGGGGGSNCMAEFIPATTGKHTIDIEIPDNVRAVFVTRTDRYPSTSDGAANADYKEVVCAFSYLARQYKNKGTQNVAWIRCNTSSAGSSYSWDVYNSNNSITTSTTAMSSIPISLAYKENSNERFSVYVVDSGSTTAGLRVGGTYRIIVI